MGESSWQQTVAAVNVKTHLLTPGNGASMSIGESDFYTVYAIYFAGFLFLRISRVGCYSRIQQHAKINLPPIPTQECDLCIRNTTCSSTVHSARANE